MNIQMIKYIAVLILCSIPLAIPAGALTSSHAVELAWEWAQCRPDGNNTHLSATPIKRGAKIFDAVCSDDTADWFIIPLQGDIMWEGNLLILTEGPGLRVAFYADTGSGPELVREKSPFSADTLGQDLYYLYWDTAKLLGGNSIGTLLPPANYYIRVTYYTYYPESHPYVLFCSMSPGGFDQPQDNTPANATPLPSGTMYHGHVDAADPTDWFKFEIPPGGSGTGLIAAEEALPRGGIVEASIFPSSPQPATFVFRINLRAADQSIIGSTIVKPGNTGLIDLGENVPTTPGTYYIEALFATSNPAEDEFNYTLVNHALAPNEGPWGTDFKRLTIGDTLQEGQHEQGSIFWPRNSVDSFSFTSQNYILGDILIEPETTLDMAAIKLKLGKGGEEAKYTNWFPGVGLSCRYEPLPPGDYYFSIVDDAWMLAPTEYTLTYYPHGVPVDGPVEHNTWEDAIELEPMQSSSGGLAMAPLSVLIEFQPGEQDAFFAAINVPTEEYLAGFFDIFGSRTDYRVALGKLGPGGSPIWAPGFDPDPTGKLTIDMNYEYLADAGTYFLRIKMLPSSPGRMRVFVDNHSRLTECRADTNNDYFDAVPLLEYPAPNSPGLGEFCPPYDVEDWFFLQKNDFNPSVGPFQHLELQGGVKGMRVRLYSDSMQFLREAKVNEVGGIVEIDLDGVIQPNEIYRIKVEANPAEERVQIYELRLKNDLIFIFPGFELLQTPQLQLKPEFFKVIVEDDD